MKLKIHIVILLISSLPLLASCQKNTEGILTGADQLEEVLPLLREKKVAIVANHTSMVSNVHLVDTLFALQDAGFEIVKLFAPEHGFRGEADAGELIGDGKDGKTGLPIISLYGSNKELTRDKLEGVELVIFDIQDIGVRFFTYLSTLHYVMEGCAENNVPLILLDRPNPNGNYIDGPLLKEDYKSFVGMHPIPIVHGCTLGEMAGMINGEGWLKEGLHCELSVIKCKNYTHESSVNLPIRPSPNLPNDHTIRMYPSTCFFEGTVISEGRGTLFPFEVYGHPELEGDFTFTPVAIEGLAMYPKFKDIECRGEDLRNFIPEEGTWNKLELRWLIKAYQIFPEKEDFFIPYFEKLAGTSTLRAQIEEGWTEKEIRDSWTQELMIYKEMRKKYLLYP